MKMAISLNRFAEPVSLMEDRNIILIPIEQGSANPINPKKNGSTIDEYQGIILLSFKSAYFLMRYGIF
jgi:hypothetical protein